MRKRGNKSNYFSLLKSFVWGCLFLFIFVYLLIHSIFLTCTRIKTFEWAKGQRETKGEKESRRTEWRWRTTHAKSNILQSFHTFCTLSPPSSCVSSVHLMSMLTFCRLQFSLLKHAHKNTGMLTVPLLVCLNILSSPVIVFVLSVSQTINFPVCLKKHFSQDFSFLFSSKKTQNFALAFQTLYLDYNFYYYF